MADSAKPKLDHQPPNLKTWVLKASVHCQGCKKKVKKILNSTPGVYDSDVDLKLQKVTVTGDIDINALIAKLIKKTGKHAEVWPEIKAEQQQPPKKQSKPKPEPKPPLGAEEVKINETEVTKEENHKTKTSVAPPPEENAKEDAPKQNVKSPAVKATGGVEEERNDKQVKTPPEKTEEDNVTRRLTAEVKQKTAEEKQTGVVDGGAAGETECGSVCKKKKKKGQNGKPKSEAQDGKDSSSDATATNDHSFQYYTPNNCPTRNFPAHMHEPPPSYHAPPVYTVSYSTTPYPNSSYGASYYAMPPRHSEAHAYPGSSTQSHPSDYASYQSQQSDTFQIFSDENPNACSLM